VTIEDLWPETVYDWRVIGHNRDGLRIESELHSVRTPPDTGVPTVGITVGPSIQVTATGVTPKVASSTPRPELPQSVGIGRTQPVLYACSVGGHRQRRRRE